MYLLDTNILLELLLDQDRADEGEQFLRRASRQDLHISDFSLYSVGIILFRRRQLNVFVRFMEDLLVRGGIRVLRLPLDAVQGLAAVADQFGLDFDDAYQYPVAQQYGLTVVSFDTDFDRTEQGRKMPQEVLP